MGVCGGGNWGTSSAVRIPSTPGVFNASEASMPRIRACGIGLLNNLQNTIPSARKSSAYLALPVTFATTSYGVKSLPISLYAISSLLRRAHDAPEVMVVSTAAAEIARHRQPRLLDRRLRVCLQQGDRRHHLAHGAEAALRTQLLDKRGLHSVQFAIGTLQPFHRGDLAAAHCVGQRRAGIDCQIVDEHRARAALTVVAAELGSDQTEFVTQRM